MKLSHLHLHVRNRTIVAKEDPRIAYDSVTRVWAPEGPWKQLIHEQLRKHRIDFEPL